MNYIKIIQNNLHKSYYSDSTQYINYKISNLILKRRSHFTLLLHEYEIDCIIDEYLKRYYKIKESIPRIPQMASFYQKYLLFFGIPIFRNDVYNQSMHSYATKKAENYYNNNIEKKDKNNKKIRNEIILTETVRKNLESDHKHNEDSYIKDIDISKIKAMIISSRSRDEESIKTILEMIDPLKVKIQKNEKESNIQLLSTVDKTKTDNRSINKKSRNKKILDNYGSKKLPNRSKSKDKSINLLKTFKTFDKQSQSQISRIIKKIKNQISAHNPLLLKTQYHTVKTQNKVSKPKIIEEKSKRKQNVNSVSKNKMTISKNFIIKKFNSQISPQKKNIKIKTKTNVLIESYFDKIKKEIHTQKFTFGTFNLKTHNKCKSKDFHQRLNTENIQISENKNNNTKKSKKSLTELFNKKFCFSYEKISLTQLKYKN